MPHFILLSVPTSSDPINSAIFSLYSTEERAPLYFTSADGLYRRGKLACFLLCAQTELCLGVNWNNALKRCEQFNCAASVNVTETAAGWNVYIKE